MGSRSKTIVCSTLTLMIFLSLMAGCAAKHSNVRKPSSTGFQQNSGSSAMLSADELGSISSGEKIILTSDTPMVVMFVPKDKETTLTKIIPWLQQAKLYEGRIPKSQVKEYFAAYVGPAVLHISIAGKQIEVMPAFYFTSTGGHSFKAVYIPDVLQMKNGGKTCYIKSKPLCDWLKNDKWKTECELPRP